MDKLDLILQKVDALQNMLAAMFVLLAIFMTGVVMYLRDFKDRHTIQNLKDLSYKLILRRSRKIFRPVKNMGMKSTTPDALPLLERYVAEYWLKTRPRVMSFAESVWLPIIRSGNFTRDDWKPLTERWKALGLVVQKDPTAKTGKGTALIAARGEIGMERKLTVILGNLPADISQMPNTGK